MNETKPAQTTLKDEDIEKLYNSHRAGAYETLQKELEREGMEMRPSLSKLNDEQANFAIKPSSAREKLTKEMNKEEGVEILGRYGAETEDEDTDQPTAIDGRAIMDAVENDGKPL